MTLDNDDLRLQVLFRQSTLSVGLDECSAGVNQGFLAEHSALIRDQQGEQNRRQGDGTIKGRHGRFFLCIV